MCIRDSIGKSFHGIQVLSDVNFDVRRGEVHCLLGENGAGKSTLIKILSGAYCLESGEIILDGKPLVNNSPSKSIQAGVSVVYQELNMIPDLPIYENVFIGKEFTKGICFDRKRQMQQTQRYLDIVGLKVDPRTLVGSLSIAQQQMVEIAKAISNNAKVLVLDAVSYTHLSRPPGGAGPQGARQYPQDLVPAGSPAGQRSRCQFLQPHRCRMRPPGGGLPGRQA